MATPKIQNVCFANSAIQCLLASPYVQAVLERKPLIQGRVMNHLRQLHLAQKANKMQNYDVWPLLVAAEQAANRNVYTDNQQHESVQFLRDLLSVANPALSNLFASTERIQRSCKRCGLKKPDSCTPYIIYAVSRPEENVEININALLTEEDEMETICDVCSPVNPNLTEPERYVPFKQTTAILANANAPHLLIRLKKFALDPMGIHAKKLLGTLNPAFENKMQTADGIKFTLSAAAMHYGENYNHGHYIAYTRLMDSWLKKNDTICSYDKQFITDTTNIAMLLYTKDSAQ